MTSLVVGSIVTSLDLDTTNIAVRVAFSFIMYAAFFGVFLAFSRLLKNEDAYKTFNLKKTVPVHDIFLILVLGAVCIVSFLLLQSGFVELFTLFGYSPTQMEILIPNFGVFLIFLFTMAVLPAIIEELLFRGLILQGLLKYGHVVAIIFSSLLFSIFHLNPSQTVYQFILGAICAVIYLRTKNMWYPIILHFINNAIIITYIYASGTEYQPLAFDATTIITTIVLSVVGGFLILRLLGLFGKPQEKTERQKLAQLDIWTIVTGFSLALIIWISHFML